MRKIIIHYPFIATYRIPIFTLLSQSDKYEYEYLASEMGSVQYILTSTENLNVKSSPLKEISIPGIRKKFEWQPGAFKFMLKEKMDAYIVLGNPNSLSTWLCVVFARLRKIPVLMWSHGYLKDEKCLKGFIRKSFYQLANSHLLYGNKAKEIMIKKGFDEADLHVIHNSLDYEKQKIYRDKLSYDARKETRLQYGFKDDSIVLIAIGRLMKKLKLEQVIEAIKVQSASGQDIRLFLIGDGPEKAKLKELAQEYKIQEKIVFYGACHDEQELAKLYNASDYSVVMGKVGLSAMHSLAYGIPMITNDNLDEHFPEIEAIVDGKTGFYFQEDNINDFNSKLKSLPYRGNIYNQCIETIEKYYTPQRQKELIENAINSVLQIEYEN
jgi:glycosyltransferase involved in cell wall biosynthesis